MFEAVPPGQHATSTTPTAKALGSAKALDTAYPSRGITVYCRAHPRETSLIRSRAPLTSSRVSVRPIPSIVELRPKTKGLPSNQLK